MRWLLLLLAIAAAHANQQLILGGNWAQIGVWCLQGYNNPTGSVLGQECHDGNIWIPIGISPNQLTYSQTQWTHDAVTCPSGSGVIAASLAYDSVWNCAQCPPGYTRSTRFTFKASNANGGRTFPSIPVCEKCSGSTYTDSWGSNVCKTCANPSQVYGETLGTSPANFSATAATTTLGIGLPIYWHNAGQAFTVTGATFEQWEQKGVQYVCHNCGTANATYIPTQQKCVQCGEGHAPIRVPAGCTECPAGTYNNPVNHACTQCSLTSVQPLRGQTSCNDCPVGSFGNTQTNNCTVCGAEGGQIVNANRTQCEAVTGVMNYRWNRRRVMPRVDSDFGD